MKKLHSKLFLFAAISMIAISYNVDVFADTATTVKFLDDSYSYEDTAVIRIFDPALNMYSESGFVDSIDVVISSDADIIGTDITLVETNGSSGIFEGTIFFTLKDYTSGHRLQVVQGGEIYVAYGDTTISAKIEGTPSPITDTTELEETPSSFTETIEENKKYSLHSGADDTLYLQEGSVSFYIVLHEDYDEIEIAHVWSDSDSEGNTVNLSKDPLRNTLHGLIQFTSDLNSLDNKLKVKSGDNIFVKYDDSTISIIIDEYVSPLKQQKSGVTSEQVVCKSDRANMQRPDGSTACMKFRSTAYFVEQGWILMPGELFRGPTS